MGMVMCHALQCVTKLKILLCMLLMASKNLEQQILICSPNEFTFGFWVSCLVQCSLHNATMKHFEFAPALFRASKWLLPHRN